MRPLDDAALLGGMLMTSKAVRMRLLASTMIAGSLAAAGPAAAQDNGTTTGQTSTPSGEQTRQSAGPAEPSSTGEIVVTGSLIKNPALTSSAPVQVLGQEELQLRQTNTAQEVLRDLPGAVADVGSAVNNGNGGASFVNLRALGSQRNLVLIDGNRIVPAGLSGQVDLNNIPLALVQRTEVLTGGASTTYGADAISGVVNFITRSDFSGFEATVSKQLTQQGDGAYYRADLTVGANFDEGRGNAVFSIGYQHSDAVYQGDRPYGRYLVDSFSGTEGGSGTTVPARFNYGLGNRQINPATGAFGPVFQRFNYNPYNVYQVPFERFNMFGAGHYAISDDLEVYTRGLFSKNTVSTIIAPSGAFGTTGSFTPFTVPYDNPYLPVAAREQICAANGLVATPTCGTGQSFTTTIGRRAVETGPRLDNYTTQVFDYRAGIKGNI
jgi:outer membrane receptor protein involved in Fe transport